MMRLPLCLAATILISATAQYDSVDTIVPDEETPTVEPPGDRVSDIDASFVEQGTRDDVASAKTVINKAKLCATAQCQYRVTMRIESEAKSSGAPEGTVNSRDKLIDVNFRLDVKKLKASTSSIEWDLNAHHYREKDEARDAAGKAEFNTETEAKNKANLKTLNRCLKESKFVAVQDANTGKLKSFKMPKELIDLWRTKCKTKDSKGLKPCCEFYGRIRNLYSGSADFIAATISAKNKQGAQLLEFTEISHSINGKKVSHHRVTRENGIDVIPA